MELYKNIITASADETEAVGRALAEEILKDATLPRFIAMEGDLGVGKTVFVRGFTSAISPESAVRSPTFALVNEYGKRGGVRVFHFDVYRIADDDDLYSTGFYDYLEEKNAVCLVEWSENIRYAFPKEYFTVRIEKNDTENTEKRSVSIYLEKVNK